MSEDLGAELGGFRSGSRIAGYLLEEQIGHGGMAVVFRALDERLNRQVALKILSPAVAADEAFRQRFIRESRAAAAVDDPHIIPVFEAGEAGRVLFIAMRLVRGGDITTLMRREGPLTGRQAAAIISPIASSLDAAHEAGLVHRDVKPANMLLDIRSGRPDHVYLSDFGLSKAALGLSAITATGQFLGTPDYMAPEQITGKAIDGRADQYSLAVTAFELLTGAPPFRNDEPMAVIFAHASEPPPALTQRRPDLPWAVDGVFARALAKAPAERFGNCQEFADALRQALGVGSYDGRPEISPDPPIVQTPTSAVPILTGVPDVAGPPTEAGWRGPQTPPPTPVLPWPGGQAGPYSPVPPPPRRMGGRVAAIVLALVIVAAGVGAALYLIKPSSGTLNHRHHRSGSSSRPPVTPVNWGGHLLLQTILAQPVTPGVKTNIVEGVAFSPDSKTLAIATVAGTYLINLASGNQAGPFAVSGDSETRAVAFSPGGRQIATADQNGHVYLWNIASSSSGPVASLADPNADRGFFTVAFSPDGKMLAAGDTGGVTYLWPVSGGTAPSSPSGQLPDPSGVRVQGIAFSPDGKMLATGDANGSTYLWKVDSAGSGPTAALADPSGQGVQAVAFSPDGQVVAAGDQNGSTYLWPVSASGQSVSPKDTLPNPGNANGAGTVAVAFSPDGRTLATGGYTGQTYLWSLASRSVIAKPVDPDISGSNQDVQAVEFSPDGKHLATGDTSGGTYLWTP